MSVRRFTNVARNCWIGIGLYPAFSNNSTRVSPETQGKVLNAIRVAWFSGAARVARQLSNGIQHRNLGVILPFITEPSFVERLRGVQWRSATRTTTSISSSIMLPSRIGSTSITGNCRASRGRWIG